MPEFCQELSLYQIKTDAVSLLEGEGADLEGGAWGADWRFCLCWAWPGLAGINPCGVPVGGTRACQSTWGNCGLRMGPVLLQRAVSFLLSRELLPLHLGGRGWGRRPVWPLSWILHDNRPGSKMTKDHSLNCKSMGPTQTVLTGPSAVGTAGAP